MPLVNCIIDSLTNCFVFGIGLNPPEGGRNLLDLSYNLLAFEKEPTNLLGGAYGRNHPGHIFNVLLGMFFSIY